MGFQGGFRTQALNTYLMSLHNHVVCLASGITKHTKLSSATDDGGEGGGGFGAEQAKQVS